MAIEADSVLKLDLRNVYCPEPFFRTKLQIEHMKLGDVVEVLVSSPGAEEDITRWVEKAGHEIVSRKIDGYWQIIIRKKSQQ